MIKSVWKPIYKNSKIIEFELVENEDILNIKGKTGYKVIWVCDDPNCRTPNLTHSINACHLRKPKMCYDTQICRPCQCTGEGNGRYGDRRKLVDFIGEDAVRKLKEEREKKRPKGVKIRKKTIITEELIKQMCVNEGFNLVSIEKLKGKYSEFTIECRLGHISEKKYMNFRRKSKFKCSKCFYESIGLKLSDEEVKIYENYKKQVRSLTAKTYREFKGVLDPDNLPKDKYHLDHKFSVSEGFKNNIDPSIISAKENLEMITSIENLSKNSKCSITLEELLLKTEYLLKNK